MAGFAPARRFCSFSNFVLHKWKCLVKLVHEYTFCQDLLSHLFGRHNNGIELNHSAIHRGRLIAPHTHSVKRPQPHPRATARVPSTHPHYQCPFRGLCKGGSKVVRSGDPCGRPGVGRFPSRSTLTECLWVPIYRAYRRFIGPRWIFRNPVK